MISPDPVRRILETEVRCYHCNARAGWLRCASNVHPPITVFQPAGGPPAMVVTSLAGLRCARCAGPLFADELDVIYRDPVDEQALDRPRRGRPRKLRPQPDEVKSA